MFEPITFLTWLHYAPAYVIGSGLLAVGIVEYPYKAIVADPVAASALALSYIGIGYLALKLGSQWRGARVLGTRLGRMVPTPPTERTTPMSAILVLIAIGMAATYGAFRSGVVGFSVPRPTGPLDAAGWYAGHLMALGHFLFWFRWFAPEQKRPSRLTLLVPLVVVVVSMVIMGNRGALLLSYLHAVLAYRFARGRLTLAQSIVAVGLAFVALGVGMVYGTTFRSLRGGESGSAGAAAKDAAAARSVSSPADPAPATAVTPAPVVTPAAPAVLPPPSLGRHLDVAAQAATSLIRDPGSARQPRILVAVGQRLNILSDASVTVNRYRAFKSLERQAGMVNIWTMTWTAFVPRFIWPGKPKVGDARAYSALYFHYGGSSYAMTPPVDLLRNVGPVGMPLGMALLGVALGVLSVALVWPTTPGRSERAALFSLILVNVNLEGTFGMILPTLARVAFVVILGLVLVRLLTFRPGSRAK